MKSKQKIFIDLDGKRARFHEEDWQNEMCDKGFYNKLKPYEDFVKNINRLSLVKDVYILSAALNPDAEVDKTEWVKRFLPLVKIENILIQVLEKDCVGYSKSQFIKEAFQLKSLSEEWVLIDDYNVNLVDWANAGGRAIKALNGFNNKKEVPPHWEGEKIDIFAEFETLQEVI